MAKTVKNLPAVRETQVHSLGREDPLEKEMATHSSILAWRIPWTEEPGGLVHGVAKSRSRACTHMYTSHGIKRNEVLMHATKWMNLENIMPSERSQTKEASV